jgi:rsbT co-antagonist protein RsbR
MGEQALYKVADGVSGERAERLMQTLSLVAVGEHAAALGLLPDVSLAEDSVSLETCVRVLIAELAASQAENARHVARLEESARELAERLAVIERQRVALADLSTPLIEVGSGTLALPVIGAVDAERARTMGERLLQRVSELRVRRVLIDLTGMAASDAVTVDNLIRVTRGVQLMGARCTLTGISPALAQTLVDLGLDIRDLEIRRTLQDALLAPGRRPAASP